MRFWLAEIPQPRRERINQRASQLIGEELSLRELRRALGRTQTKMASYLRVGQDTISRYEQRSDLLLSTLRPIPRGNRWQAIVALPHEECYPMDSLPHLKCYR
jgi:DNA-binding XRE family transcriptional regulator